MIGFIFLLNINLQLRVRKQQRGCFSKESDLRAEHNNKADVSKYLTNKEPRCRGVSPGQDQGQRHWWRSNTVQIN